MMLKKWLIACCICVSVLACNEAIDSKHPSESINNIQTKTDKLFSYTPIDQSQMDMIYFPPDYPLLRMNCIDSPALVARVIYSRPQKNNRVIFGNDSACLVHYGKEWRLGANEASEIEFFRDVRINNKNIDKGRYVMYCIPETDSWTIVLNSNLFTWGLYMESSMDVYKLKIPVAVQSPSVEFFTMLFEPSPKGTNLLMAWDNVKAFLPIEVK